MLKILLIFSFFFVGCIKKPVKNFQTMEVLDENYQPTGKTEQVELIKEDIIINKSSFTDWKTVKQTCNNKTSYCFGCGLTVFGKVNCGFDLRFNCPGTKTVKTRNKTNIYQIKYTTRKQQNINYSISPEKKEVVQETKDLSKCE
jgi:hypothetical protein